jgi:hypothetical protein
MLGVRRSVPAHAPTPARARIFARNFPSSVAAAYDRQNPQNTIHHFRIHLPSHLPGIDEKIFAIKYELSHISR